MTNSDSRLPDEYVHDGESPTTSDRLRVVLEIAIAALILTGIYYLFEPEDEINLTPPLEESQIDPIIRAQIDSAREPSTPAVEDSNKTDNVATAIEAPPPENAQVSNKDAENNSVEGGSARALISRLRSGETTYSPQQILDQVSAFQNQGKATDAYLLLFYAAREGNGNAAFSLASMHDPNHFSDDNALLEKPDSYQAHKWYTAALDKGVAEARERLRKLKKSTEEQAKEGNLAAQRLLLNWR